MCSGRLSASVAREVDGVTGSRLYPHRHPPTLRPVTGSLPLPPPPPLVFREVERQTVVALSTSEVVTVEKPLQRMPFFGLIPILMFDGINIALRKPRATVPQ
ncbi:hypothetical protein F2P81_005290 [Scophthalmus maximus]|uniref:Uncharacterized protein n=1 Tax=Scophthalmus maximus TaxID=52904 RepID=A0A6A4TBJ5_SCOMX|nr:hypothetical protein F2P81_005290 [Scophthalmus maximus]